MDNGDFSHQTLEILIADYSLKHRQALLDHLHWYPPGLDIEELVRRLSKCEVRANCRHTHQRRLRNATKDAMHDWLIANRDSWLGANNFEQLFAVIDRGFLGIHHAGNLMAYDTALRLGAFKQMYPETVFLQAGSLVGAKTLARLLKSSLVKPITRHVKSSFLGAELTKLLPMEIENFLCIYFDKISVKPNRQPK